MGGLRALAEELYALAAAIGQAQEHDAPVAVGDGLDEDRIIAQALGDCLSHLDPENHLRDFIANSHAALREGGGS
ncbi:MAG: hypothetical protein AAGL98_14215 [Planctomycetota bacterium]